MMWCSMPNACEHGCSGIDPAFDELAPGSSVARAPDPSVPVMPVHLTGPQYIVKLMKFRFSTSHGSNLNGELRLVGSAHG